MARLVSELGLEGYGFYWLILETVAGRIEAGSNCTQVTYPVAFWRKITGLSPKKLRNFAEICSKIGILSAEFSENSLTINMPNILKYRDEWSRKVGKNSGVTPKPLRSKISDSEEEKRNTLLIQGIAMNEDPAGARVVVPVEGLRPASEVGDGGRERKPSAAMPPADTAPSDKSEGMQNFEALRALWDKGARKEGIYEGLPAWVALREQADYPGDAEVLAAAQATVAARRWRHGFAPGLARFLTEGMWRDAAQAPAQPIRRPSEAPSTTSGDVQPADTPTTTAPASVQGRA